METCEAIRTRRSIRSFVPKPVSAEDLQEILTAAMYAPSAGDEQPWHFVVIEDRAVLQRIPEVHPYASMAPQAGVGILVCGDLRLERYPGFWVQDCSAAVQNMLLAAPDLGLGSLWTGIYPAAERVSVFQKMFALPAEVVPLALVLVDQAAVKPAPPSHLRGRWRTGIELGQQVGRDHEWDSWVSRLE